MSLFDTYEKVLNDPTYENMRIMIFECMKVIKLNRVVMFRNHQIYKDYRRDFYRLNVFEWQDQTWVFRHLREFVKIYKKWLKDRNFFENYLHVHYVELWDNPVINKHIYGIYPHGSMKNQLRLLINHLVYARTDFSLYLFTSGYKNICVCKKIIKNLNLNDEIYDTLKYVKDNISSFVELDETIQDLNKIIEYLRNLKKPKILKDKFYHDTVIIVKTF